MLGSSLELGSAACASHCKLRAWKSWAGELGGKGECSQEEEGMVEVQDAAGLALRQDD
jgi:hypothetical protein